MRSMYCSKSAQATRKNIFISPNFCFPNPLPSCQGSGIIEKEGRGMKIGVFLLSFVILISGCNKLPQKKYEYTGNLHTLTEGMSKEEAAKLISFDFQQHGELIFDKKNNRLLEVYRGIAGSVIKSNDGRYEGYADSFLPLIFEEGKKGKLLGWGDKFLKEIQQQ